MNWLRTFWTRFRSLWQRLAVKREASLGEATLQDIRFGLRMIAKNPGFSAVIILTLGLGIGANTAIFSVVNAVLLRPLPYPAPEQLVQVKKLWQHAPWAAGPTESTSMHPSEAQAWMEENQVFSQMAAFDWQGANLSGGDQAERVDSWKVSLSFLSLLGALPALGRDFLPEEDRSGGPAVAILSHGLWQRNFGGDTNVLGRTIKLDEKPYTVVGVLGSTFQFDYPYDLLVPLALDKSNKKNRPFPNVIGRLKPGVTHEQARLALDAIYQSARDPKTKDWGGRVLVQDLTEHLVGGVKPIVLVYQGAVGLVLLIACANVANLLLARAATRRKEIAIRVALGAGRLRIVRQLLTESVLLAALGGALGLLLAFWCKGLVCHSSANLPALRPIEMDGWVLAFTLLLVLGTGLVFGLAPALETSRLSVNDWLKEGGRGATGGLHRHRLSKLLVVLEVALTLVLLVSAGLLIECVVRMRGERGGFRAERLLTGTIVLTESKYPDGPSRSAYFAQVLERLRNQPGVESVGANSALPHTQSGLERSALEIEGRPADSVGGNQLNCNIVNGDYFRAMGIPLLKGRCFTDGDRVGAPSVVLVGESFVRQYFPQEECLGRRIREDAHSDWKTIIGVTGDVREGVKMIDSVPQLYSSYLQEKPEVMSLAVRTRGNPRKLAAAVRSVIRSVDKDQPVYDLMTMEDRLNRGMSPIPYRMMLLSLSAALALGLATLGIYGVLSYSVAQRTHEIGVRMALGAQAADVLRLVVGQGLRLALSGIIVGLAAAFGLTRLLRNLYDDVRPFDLPTFAGVSLFLGIVVLVACYLPARKAARVDPIVALRCE